MDSILCPTHKRFRDFFHTHFKMPADVMAFFITPNVHKSHNFMLWTFYYCRVALKATKKAVAGLGPRPCKGSKTYLDGLVDSITVGVKVY